MKSAALVVAGCLAGVISCGSSDSPVDATLTSASQSAPVAASPCTGSRCWVAVSVATVWHRPSDPRPVDRPAVSYPAYPQQWLDGMTTADRAGLVGRIETQVRYGTRVRVLAHRSDGWDRVVVPSQPTHRDRRGYPGWVPARQLTATGPGSANRVARVVMPTSWIYRLTTAGGEGKRLLRLSYGTQLPVVSTSTSDVVVSLLDGRRGLLPRADVALEASGNHPAASPRLILAEARKFLGLGYLWGGTSGFGFDCSGFSYAVFRTFGISLARDADDQALGGRSVSISRLQRGDLVFFRSQPGGDITHVGIAVGHGRMIDAPHTGVGIRIESITGFGGYAGARRYLPS